MGKIIIDIEELKGIRRELRKEGRKLVFTNGCFDILHAGHVDYLNKAKAAGDVLLVALNDDKSVKSIKGDKRPIIPQEQRAFLVANLNCVDYVTFFSEDTPEQLINIIIPDILIKGADWNIEDIVGREVVESNGGEVKTIEFVTEQSTSDIINTILKKYKD